MGIREKSTVVKIFIIILWIIQTLFGLFGLLIAFCMLLSFDFLSILAACITVISALIIFPIMDFIKPIRKYTMLMLAPRAILSFSVLAAAFMIFPETSIFNGNYNAERRIAQETTITTTSTTTAATIKTTSATTSTTITTTTATTTTSKTTTTTTKSTTTTATTTKATTTTIITTTEPPTEPPTPAPTEAPYVPPAQTFELDYVLNTSTMKFHYPDCPSAKKINPENRSETHASRDDVISWGYDPCGRCRP